MINTTVKGVQKLKADLKQAIRNLDIKDTVLVGINEGAGVHPESDLTVATIGAIQEFGTATIPARPWLKPGVESATADINNYLKKQEAKEDRDIDKMLNTIGMLAQQSTQLYITELKSPPNADSTVKKKGSANPLIDTGTLRGSVTYVITKEQATEGIV